MNRYFGLHTLEGEWHSLLPRYLLLADRVAGRRVLDIGCGTGIGSSLLLEMGAERVDAIDHRPAVLEIARMKHAKQGLDFHVMFWEELDFPEDTFDIVLCLDPSSPVTDPNLLLEMRRVLKAGGEYVCAIERKNIKGIETVLPRYGYADAAQSIDVHDRGERVPQIGELTKLFETVVSVVQQPHLSYVFDLNPERKGHLDPEGEHVDEMRKVSASGESGLWGGNEAGAEGAEADHGPVDRWISMDNQFCSHRDEASVELLFCGDSHLPPAPVREIRMPYYALVERLNLMTSELQSRARQGEEEGFGELVDNASTADFNERELTGEYRALTHWEDVRETTNAPLRREYAPAQQSVNYELDADQLLYMQRQLDQVGVLYHQVRTDMEDLAYDTRRELAERDRYIEQLVGTIHRWEHHFYGDQSGATTLDGEKTGVFDKLERPELEFAGDLQADEQRAPITDEATPDQPEASLVRDEEAPIDESSPASGASGEDGSVEEQIAPAEKKEEEDQPV
ncbi:MAG: class I SAM-dependent methyltransferase [Bradymonadaceae bacterium]|nr:class I SAM-dependent methyltransferase [Lujinxingiaceae bacterium]